MGQREQTAEKIAKDACTVYPKVAAVRAKALGAQIQSKGVDPQGGDPAPRQTECKDMSAFMQEGT